MRIATPTWGIGPVVGHDCDGALVLQQAHDLKPVFVLRTGGGRNDEVIGPMSWSVRCRPPGRGRAQSTAGIDTLSRGCRVLTFFATATAVFK